MKLFNKKIKICFLLLSAFLFIKCVDLPDEVVLPEWDVNLNVPLLNKTYTLKEIIKEQEHIIVDTTNNIFLLQSGKYFLNSSLSEFVQINETSSLENVPTLTSQTDSFIVYVQFPEGLEVDSGEFASGLLSLSVDNPSAENVSVILRIPAFHNSTNDQIRIQTNVPAGQTTLVNFDLNGYRYERPPDQPMSLRNSFRLVVRAFSQQPNVVYTNLSMSDLAFNYITGVVPSKSLGDQISTYDFDVNQVEEYRDKSFLSDAKMQLKANYFSVFNTPNILEIRNLNIIARRNDGTELLLRDKTNNPYFTLRMENGNLNTVFNEENSNINEFVSFFPDSVVLLADYVVNPDNNTGTFSNQDSIRFETDFSTRSFLALKTITVEDETGLDISEHDREDIIKGKNAVIGFEIENALPLKAWLRIDALDDYGNYLFTITENENGIDSISFEAASVNSSGEVIESNINPVKMVTLNDSQIKFFAKTYSLRYRVSFHTTDSSQNPPQIVSIRPSNWIKVKTFGSIKYKISNDD